MTDTKSLTYEEFKNLYYINKNLSRLLSLREFKEQRLEELRSRSTALSGMNLSGMPRSPTRKSKTEDVIIQIDLLERELKELDRDISKERIRFDSVRRELKSVIDLCNDERIAMIMRYRFLDLRSWLSIAMELGGKNTEDAVRKACNRYIREHYPQK